MAADESSPRRLISEFWKRVAGGRSHDKYRCKARGIPKRKSKRTSPFYLAETRESGGIRFFGRPRGGETRKKIAAADSQ